MVGWGDRLKGLLQRWNKLPLANKFALSGATITVAAMILSGVLTTTALTEIVLARRGGVVAAVIHHMLADRVQALQSDGETGARATAELDAIMGQQPLSSEFPYLDIWLPDGTILYSNVAGLAGQQIARPPPVQSAFSGQVAVDFTDVSSDDYEHHHLEGAYIEIHFPLRVDGDIVAVAQMREVTTDLEQDLWSLTLSSWVIVMLVATVVMAGLFSIVLEGSRKIERQGRVLSRRLAHSHARAAHHRELKAEAQQASRVVTQLTDKHLRAIGTDLHDGPAQAIGYAVLRLDAIRRLPKAAERNVIVADVEEILGNAATEIRSIAMALVLPDIEELDVSQVVERAIKQHVQRTGAVIAVDSAVEPVHVAPEVAVCVYRFIQEGLNNAFHHGLPDGPTLTAMLHGGLLKLSITNGYVEDPKGTPADHLGIGLYGLRARVQSIGGKFTFVQGDGKTRLEMWLRNV
ncbi:sensor histidine kinase [Devosia ureilytica]|uniref:Signal transduction histidine kinase subgroup 3 dimerisation and phosphoacceptor domain-containing protein n=1 Tax=Devosia ureilytica TaxID=2952754 RepID=A0A9Q4FSX4_9HYPH|nr:hypothetical protein [Devosia ureilytica]MCP8887335.1 hypothetical protein [Devosia ureilytica]